ncbi:hypothetical protein H4R33_006442, partial [Dimargaris cristalligena]
KGPSRTLPKSNSPSTKSAETQSRLEQNIAQEKQINSQIQQNLGAFFKPRETAIPLQRVAGSKTESPLITIKNRSKADNIEQINTRNKLSSDALQLFLIDLKPPPGQSSLSIAELSRKYNIDENLVRVLGHYYSPTFPPPPTKVASADVPKSTVH